MVGSIDPRCETLRGTHWPKKGRVVVWNSRRGTPSWPAVQNDRINRPDIWMQAIRSDRQKNLRHEGRPHMGPGVCRDDRLRGCRGGIAVVDRPSRNGTARWQPFQSP
jgi:hypothetical protein